MRALFIFLLLTITSIQLSFAHGPLRSNLKLAAMHQAKGVEESIFVPKVHMRREPLEQDDLPPLFKYYVKPFSASPYYDFFDALLVGLKLENFFKGSEACLFDIVYFIDDLFYFRNNISDFQWQHWEAPMMNLSKAFTGNFGSAIVDCQLMGSNMISYGVEKYKLFNYDIGSFILAFLFNIMGNALTFKNIFDEIQKDINNQYYADIFTQYGRLIRTIFDFSPMETVTTASFQEEWVETFAQKIDTALGADPKETRRWFEENYKESTPLTQRDV